MYKQYYPQEEKNQETVKLSKYHLPQNLTLKHQHKYGHVCKHTYTHTITTYTEIPLP